MVSYYTSVSKGGVYELIGAATGAGSNKGMPLVIYKDVNSGTIYHRQPEDFAKRMKKLDPQHAAVLAALSS